ncbi:MAG TPA: hypothetical protein DCX95_00755 [Elusimicrobia bacterium]|nr:hypothetical protein [Elusimicrobiota bacterium]
MNNKRKISIRISVIFLLVLTSLRAENIDLQSGRNEDDLKYSQAKVLEERGDIDNAEKIYKELAQKEASVSFNYQGMQFAERSSKIEGLMGLARVSEKKGNFENAINLYKNVVISYPDSTYNIDSGNGVWSHASYSIDAFNELLRISNARYKNLEIPESLIEEIEKKQEEDEENRKKTGSGVIDYCAQDIRRHILFKLGDTYWKFYHNRKKAIDFYNKVIEKVLAYNETELNLNEGDFAGFGLTDYGLAKQKINEIISVEIGKTPTISILHPESITIQSDYLWDKVFVRVHWPGIGKNNDWLVETGGGYETIWFFNKSRIVRNEIYARHGYIFKSPELKQQFESKNWYKPNPNFSEKELNQIEKRNVQYLKEFEDCINSGYSLNKDKIKIWLEKWEK